MEGALICYTQSNNCSGSCVILSSDQECCDKNATSIYVLGNDTCLDSINLCGRCKEYMYVHTIASDMLQYAMHHFAYSY